MSGEENSPDVMVQWYRDRIAEPRTGDEVYGYWVFVFGILLGILGILLFLTSDVDVATTPGQAGIGLAAVSLVLLMVGPIIRLPLQRPATLVSYAGAFVSFAGVVAFLLEYPGWRDSGLAVPIISLYALGLVLIAAGAALVPVVRGSTPDLDGPDAGPEPSIGAIEAEPTDLVDDAPPESKARFELFEDRGGKWRWRLRHRNGNVIADGGQGYSSRQKARQGLESVQKNAAGAAVIREETEDEDGDEAEPADAPYPPGESQGTFDAYEDAAGEYRWRLVHDNGEIVADGGEGYGSRTDVAEAVERVREYVGAAEYLRIDPTAFEVYEDDAGEWRWRLAHRNGNILADSGEGYASRSNARRAVRTVREAVGDDDAFEVYEDDAGEWRWRLGANNGEILADGGEGYASESAARSATERVGEYAPEAHALDYSEPVFELYEDAAREFRWRLRTPNGEILADSGEGYASRSGARDGIHSVKRNAPNAEYEGGDAS